MNQKDCDDENKDVEDDSFNYSQNNSSQNNGGNFNNSNYDSTNMNCNDIPNGFQDLDPQLFVLICEILGNAFAGSIPFNVQNAIGNWFELIGQIILTCNAQQQYFQGGPGRYFDFRNFNVSNPFCGSNQSSNTSNKNNSSSNTKNTEKKPSKHKNEETNRIKELEDRINEIQNELVKIKNEMKK